MLPKLVFGRLGPLGMAITTYELWMRLPAKQRRQLLLAARKHGARSARYAARKGSEQIQRTRSKEN